MPRSFLLRHNQREVDLRRHRRQTGGTNNAHLSQPRKRGNTFVTEEKRDYLKIMEAGHGVNRDKATTTKPELESGSDNDITNEPRHLSSSAINVSDVIISKNDVIESRSASASSQVGPRRPSDTETTPGRMADTSNSRPYEASIIAHQSPAYPLLSSTYPDVVASHCWSTLSLINSPFVRRVEDSFSPWVSVLQSFNKPMCVVPAWSNVKEILCKADCGLVKGNSKQIFDTQAYDCFAADSKWRLEDTCTLLPKNSWKKITQTSEDALLPNNSSKKIPRTSKDNPYTMRSTKEQLNRLLPLPEKDFSNTLKNECGYNDIHLTGVVSPTIVAFTVNASSGNSKDVVQPSRSVEHPTFPVAGSLYRPYLDCPRAPTKSTLEVPARGKDGKTKKHPCDTCGRAFSRTNTLITHRRIHTGEKPFRCEICGRKFRQPGNLTRHRLTHTMVKPYACAVCLKAFNRLANLRTHMGTHEQRQSINR